MKIKPQEMVGIISIIAALAAVIQISAVIAIEKYQSRKNAAFLPHFKKGGQKSKTLVVYFSRSGNTELMAHQIADSKNGNIFKIDARGYQIGFSGWANAMLDARKTNAIISDPKLDLSAYDTVYIGSPIWLYAPAPPVFEFVKHNDFTGKKVILFNSLNSKFEQKYIDEFSALVDTRGGRFVKHIYVVRGRMTRQLSTPEFLDSVKNRLSP